MSEKVSVTVFEDGPIKVSNATSVRYCGQRIESEGDLFLCRCGESANAPFCDGTHRKVKFSGVNEQQAAEPITTWEGRTLRTHFNPNVCMHVYYCKPLAALREAELAGDDSAAVKIAKVVGLCPSGALRAESKGAELPNSKSSDTQIDIIEGGEIRILVDCDLSAERQEGQPDDRATLCRCGLSKNKPWCDGRHKKRTSFR